MGVIVQGLLGGFRVLLHAQAGGELALIHGCFGQMVFALLVGVALITSRHWQRDGEAAAPGDQGQALRRWSLVLVGLMIGQLLLGAFVRHRLLPLAQRGHLLVAFAVLASIVWIAKVAWTDHAADRNLTRAVRLLLILVSIQLLLGVEAWMIRAPQLAAGSEVVVDAPGVSLFSRQVVRSLHVLVGSGLLATAVATALEAHRSVARNLLSSPAARLEEVA